VETSRSPKPKQKSLKQIALKMNFVLVKEEAVEIPIIQEQSFCRCCFVPLSSIDAQVSIDLAKNQFHEITQTSLVPSRIADTFCQECYEQIQHFCYFKNLAILKQQKFMEMLENGGNFRDIHGIQQVNDWELKEENQPASVIETIKLSTTEKTEEAENLLIEINKGKGKTASTKLEKISRE
jgi:hypothetical protein